ncbi:MAG: SDR family NAD(P)-dependent oxidoreductase [Desulfitobacteriaceae bacterium]|nr:SDR family NAD(P)-dependent oxidoreductase [Desulfitobacteriaceae bacterium]MDD4346451.1 SDR family NAD(P)-dependent oxidoreductase [Desulfitobacteriaceae bacterium]MDD4401930.1 SDR family NAD(P)-dependent oxidoreductase [Desulfitobacteriaceae bacterium]
MKIAIITGASSGLGKAFAEKIAKTGGVDELWVIARRVERLNTLANELKIAVRPLALDLGNTKSIEEIERLLNEEKPDVRYLVNAAGFGKFGNYNDLTREESRGILDINVRALMDVTLAVLPYMSRGSRLFEIASSSAFQPLPGFNIYAATKAFVLSYTRSLRWELRGRGIHVTAVCPGWIKTEFMKVAVDTRNGILVKNFWAALQPSFVAGCAMLGNKLGFAVVTCGPHTFIHRLAAKILPSWLIMGIWRLIR